MVNLSYQLKAASHALTVSRLKQTRQVAKLAAVVLCSITTLARLAI